MRILAIDDIETVRDTFAQSFRDFRVAGRPLLDALYQWEAKDTPDLKSVKADASQYLRYDLIFVDYSWYGDRSLHGYYFCDHLKRAGIGVTLFIFTGQNSASI